MYCHYCEREHAASARFCTTCGATLATREPEAIRADLSRVRFLLIELGRWTQAGRITPQLAEELAQPYRRSEKLLAAALGDEAHAEPIGPTAIPAPRPAPESLTNPSMPGVPPGAEGEAATGLAADAGSAVATTGESIAPSNPSAESELAAAGVDERGTAERPSAGVPASVIDAMATGAADQSSAAPGAAGSLPRPGTATTGVVRSEEASEASVGASAAAGPSEQPGDERGDERLLGLTAALAAEGMAEHLDPERAPLTEEQAVLERESPWSRIWRPFLYENIGWFIGAFLLLAGSFYFVAESKGLHRTLLVSGLLSAYASGFWFVGRHLATRQSLTTAGRVLASIAGALSPMVILALEPLRPLTFTGWLAAAAAGVLGMTWLVRACAGVFGDTQRRAFTLAAGTLLAGLAATPLLSGNAGFAAADGLALILLWAAAGRLGTGREDRGHAAFLGVGTAWLGLVLIVRVHYQALGVGTALGFSHYGPLLTLVIAALLRGERALRGEPPRSIEAAEAAGPAEFSETVGSRAAGPSGLAVLFYVALIPAVLASIGQRGSLAVACAVSALLLARAAHLHRSRGFGIVALVAGWIAFHTFSGLFRREWILAFRDGVKALAGYGYPDALPWNYGALATLLYLAALLPLYHRARRAQATWALRALRAFTPVLTASVLAWAHLGSDFKPALIAALCVAALSHVASVGFGHARLAYLTAATLVIAALDAALLFQTTPGAGQLGLALGALGVLALSRAAAGPRRRAFVEIALPAAAIAALLTIVSGTGSLAGLAALAAGLACVASAFALGSALPTALGLAAAVVGCLHLAATALPQRMIPWVLLALAATLLGASGSTRRHRDESAKPHWLGLELAMPARGFDVLREPLAWLAALSLIACIPFGPILGAAVAPYFGAVAVGFFLTARRFSSPLFLYPGVLLMMLAAMLGFGTRLPWDRPWRLGMPWPRPEWPVLETAALVAALLAVALRRSERAARTLLRLPASVAALPFAICASVVAAPTAVASVIVHSADYGGLALVLGALSYLALAHWSRGPLWLYPASALGVAAVGLITRADLALVFAGSALLHLGLGLLEARAPRIPRTLLGADRLPRHLWVLAHLSAALALLASFNQSPAALAAGLLAVFYALAPRLDGRAPWLAVSGLAAWAAAALTWPSRAWPLLAVFSVVLAAAGALCRAWPRASERLLATRPSSAARALTGTGLLLAGVALSAALSGVPPAHQAAQAGLVALALALAPRTFPSPLWLGAAAATALLACAWALPGMPLPAVIAGFAVAVPLIGLLARRVPAVLRLGFSLGEEHVLEAARTLTATGLAASALALGLELTGLLGLTAVQSWSFAATAVLIAAGALFGFLASSWSALLGVAGSALVLACAGSTGRLEHGFLAASAALNALLLLAGALESARGRAAATRVCDAVSAPALRRGLPAGSVAGLLATCVAWTGVGLLTIGAVALVRWVAFALGLDPLLAMLMLGAQIFTAWHLIRRQPSLLSWHLALPLLPIGLWLLGGPTHWPWLAGAACIVLALLEGRLDREEGGKLLTRLGLTVGPWLRAPLAALLGVHGWALALLAIAGTGFETRHLATPAAFTLVAVAFGLRGRRGARGAYTTCLALVPLALHFALFFVGHALSTGRPPATILPSLAAAMALAALVAEGLGTAGGARRVGLRRAAHAYATIATVEWIAGVALVDFHATELWASSLSILGLTAFHAIRARTSGSELHAYLAHLAFLAGYLSLRLHTPWFGSPGRAGDADAIAGLVFGFLQVGLLAMLRRLGPNAFLRPTQVMAHLMPLAGALLLRHEATLLNTGLLFAYAVQLTALAALIGRGRIAGLLAAVACNVAIALLWLRSGITGADKAQFYVIPAGLTLVALARIYRATIGDAWQSRLRAVGVLAIYLSAVAPALSSFDRASYVLWCVLLCVVGVAAGIALRVRAYLYLGTGFLVTCVVGNLVRHGVRDHQIGAAALTAMGLLIVAGMIYFNLRREQLLRRYQKLQELLSGWQ